MSKEANDGGDLRSGHVDGCGTTDTSSTNLRVQGSALGGDLSNVQGAREIEGSIRPIAENQTTVDSGHDGAYQ